LRPPPARQAHVGEAFTAFDACHPDVSAQIQVGGQSALGDGDLKGPASGNRRHRMSFCGRYLVARDSLVSNYPAGHRDFQQGNQMMALLQMAFERDGVVSGIKRAG